MKGQLCADCESRPAIVGWGDKPTWICQECLEDRLIRVRDVLDAAREALS